MLEAKEEWLHFVIFLRAFYIEIILDRFSEKNICAGNFMLGMKISKQSICFWGCHDIKKKNSIFFFVSAVYSLQSADLQSAVCSLQPAVYKCQTPLYGNDQKLFGNWALKLLAMWGRGGDSATGPSLRSSTGLFN